MPRCPGGSGIRGFGERKREPGGALASLLDCKGCGIPGGGKPTPRRLYATGKVRYQANCSWVGIQC